MAIRANRTQEEYEALQSSARILGKRTMEDMKDASGNWVLNLTIDGKKYVARTYNVWQMLKNRGIAGGRYQELNTYYVGTTVCDEWVRDFNTFADWYTAQTGYGEGWSLDKDVKGDAMHYSPETCMLLPNDVNQLFRKRYYHLAVHHYGGPYIAANKCFKTEHEARVHAHKVRVDRVGRLKAKYPQLPAFIWEKAYASIPAV